MLLLVDDSVRLCEDAAWNRQPDFLRGFQIDEQLELRRLLYRQVGRLGSLQDSIHVARSAAPAVHLVRPVVHEPAVISASV